MSCKQSANIKSRVTLVALACLAFAGAIEAKNVTVRMQVDSKGLDLNRPQDAHTLYVRINRAAYLACTSADQLGLAPVDNQTECIGKSVAAAVRAVNAPLLTQAYLWNHTPQQAATEGIYSTAKVASK